MFLPDAAARKVKTSIGKGFAEVKALGICMEDIDRSVIRLGIKQELIEGAVFHIVVLSLTGASFVINIVRRVRHDNSNFKEMNSIPLENKQKIRICFNIEDE